MDIMPLGFIFGSPFAAFGALAGAVAVPIIIHLLNRRRYRVVLWAAMRFLLAAERKNAKKMRIEQLLLLAVRTALVLLLVLAMASVMPWAERIWHELFPASVAKAADFGMQRTHRIIVLDGSLSMATRIGDQTCFERAKAVAEQLVRDAPRGDGFSVVLMSAPPRRIVPEPSDDASKVIAEIAAARLPHGNSDLAATLNTVENLVRQSPAKFGQREIYFLTDLQQSSWLPKQRDALAPIIQKIQERTHTSIIVDVGADGIANTAVTSLTLGTTPASTGESVAINATIHNYGQAPRDNARVELWVGKARVNAADPPLKMRIEAQRIEQLGDGAHSVTFLHNFRTPGEYVVQVRVEPDALEVDDVRTIVVSVKKDIPVMLVNGKPAVEAFDRGTEWLRLALNPAFDGSEALGVVPVRPKVLSVKEFNDAGLGDLTDYDCVFFAGVPSFTPAEVRRIEMHLRRGGGTVFGLGERIDFGAYNEFLYKNGNGILPAKLVKEQPRPSNSYYHFAIDDKDYREPPLDSFDKDFADRHSLTSAVFRQYVSTELAPRGQPRKFMAFTPEPNKERGPGAEESARLPRGEPALVEWQPLLPANDKGVATGRYRGRVVLFTSTFNMDWNTWPVSPSFPAFMQELLHFAVAGKLREQAMLVGEPLEEFITTRGGGLEVTLRTPDSRKEEFRTEPQDEATLLRWTETDQSGVYIATIGSDQQEHIFAVNPPTATEDEKASESNLTRVGAEELRGAYPEWELQVVKDLRDATHPRGSSVGSEYDRPLGPLVAHWLLLAALVLLLAEVVLAWHFGHYSAVAGGFEAPPAQGRLLPILGSTTAFFIAGGVAFILIHNAWTGDFLGFIPDYARSGLERALGVPPPAAGEGSHWRLELLPYLWDSASDTWLVGFIALAGIALIVGIYWREGRSASGVYRGLLAGVRVCFLLLTLVVLLPQLKLWFERQSWPDLVLIIDDSASMSIPDHYRDPAVQVAADQLARVPGINGSDRLALARALLTRDNPDWLRSLLTERKVKVHVYHCSYKAHRFADIAEVGDIPNAVQAVRELGLQLESKNDASQLGGAVRHALDDFRGSSLAAVVMLTDGVTTEGEDLVKVSKYAAQVGVPLFFVGIGDAHQARDLIVNDVQVADWVYVNDIANFTVQLTAQGFNADLEVPVQLFEKGKENGKPLDEKYVKFDKETKTITLRHRPIDPGDKIYVIKVPVQPDEPPENNRMERHVLVREAKIHKVLYIEQYPRWEYRYIKSLLERETPLARGNKAIDLRVLLLEADPDYAMQDRSALVDFPTHAELNQFDVVILGDVDPKSSPRMNEHLKEIADFVRQRGGGLLMIAGERYSPRVYKGTPLKDILPIDLSNAPAEEEPDKDRTQGYRPELTPLGRMHQIFRFDTDNARNEEIWGRLREMYWYAEGYQPKRLAEVLAILPQREGESKERQALAVQQFVGAGRSMFFGFNETWRWRFREDEENFNKFWIQTVRYLAVGRLGRTDLKVDKQVPYRRGEPIRVTARFPDDSPPPPPETEVKVLVERRPLRSSTQPETNKQAAVEVQTVKLDHVPGSRAAYEAILTRTPEGEYSFALATPSVQGPKPTTEARVLPPPGEMDQLRMNKEDMEKAAQESHGKFYTLADADKLLDELPSGVRVTLNAPGPPALLWNHTLVFLFALGLLTLEWVLRKRKHLL
jgi:hypothetical protein